MSNFIGIDPGKNGGLAAVGDEPEGLRMPIAGSDIDCRVIRDFLIKKNPLLVVIEKVGAMPKQGVKSMFSFGEAYGTVKGIVDALAIPYMLVPPQTWKKKILAGTPKEKQDAINFSRRLYPEVNLIPDRCRKPHDGIADAVCLAEYARLTCQKND